MGGNTSLVKGLFFNGTPLFCAPAFHNLPLPRLTLLIMRRKLFYKQVKLICKSFIIAYNCITIKND